MLLQVAVVLSEKVDSTLTKGVLRIIGSAVGGTFGELVCLECFPNEQNRTSAEFGAFFLNLHIVHKDLVPSIGTLDQGRIVKHSCSIYPEAAVQNAKCVDECERMSCTSQGIW